MLKDIFLNIPLKCRLVVYIYLCYKLNNYIFVTGEHKILVDDNKKDIEGFKPVSEVSYALKTDICDEQLSCLITSNHRIPIGEYTFWDWED